MTDWKDVLIDMYLTTEREKRTIDVNMLLDPEISKLKAQIETTKEIVASLELGYKERIRNNEMKMQNIKDELKGNWDIPDKTFKCPAGNATIKTTKSLVITNNSGLIERLTAIFESAPKACDCIRSFDLSAIRKFMNANLIDEKIAHYDRNQSVIITEAKDK